LVSLGKWIILGLAGAFAISALVDPARAQGTVSAFGGIGTALGSLGGGIQSLLTGVGTGGAKLLNPLFTLRDLIYPSQAGVQVQSDIEQVTSTGNIQASQIAAQQRAIELDPAAPFTPITTGFGGTPLYTPQAAEQGAAQAAQEKTQGFSYSFRPSISPAPVAQATFHGQSLPLSQAAINHYQSQGVAVSPSNNQTVSSQNSGNATSSSAATSNYQSGQASGGGSITSGSFGSVDTSTGWGV